MPASRVFVVGVGMTKFEKPGGREWDCPDMGREAGLAALADAGGLISKGHPLGATSLGGAAVVTMYRKAVA